MQVVQAISGGMDSTVLAYMLANMDELAALISVDYGQRHRRELGYAQGTAQRLRVPFYLVDLRTLNPLIQGSALTDQSVQVPEGHYSENSMRATVVPNRNMILLSILAAHAVAIDADAIAYAAHKGDAAQYPDCRSEFIDAMEEAICIGNLWSQPIAVLSPFIRTSKAEIAMLGATLHVPWHSTYSCYQGGEVHCGRCGTCVERLEAFYLAGITEPTQYADREYWKTVCPSYIG